MPLIRLLLKYWVPVLLWMALIFSASGDTKSYDRSSRIIAPLVRLLFPSLSEGAVDRMVLVARKGAHVTEYAVLAVLCWYAIRRPVRSDPRPWSWRQAGIAFLIVAAYAATDEWHQSFVPGRDGHVRDVLIDSAGGALGLLALRAFYRPRPAESTVIQSANP
ncbi:MAG TPA: VanZ family protein [Verrucomicrobiota bacterium]|nr:VanZ family protein [Verrucomicrobiota bacterium]HOP98143.1 VanZ family protein [Verrucomicrobiota bacterium]